MPCVSRRTSTLPWRGSGTTMVSTGRRRGREGTSEISHVPRARALGGEHDRIAHERREDIAAFSVPRKAEPGPLARREQTAEPLFIAAALRESDREARRGRRRAAHERTR